MIQMLESVWWCVVALYAVLFVHQTEDREEVGTAPRAVRGGRGATALPGFAIASTTPSPRAAEDKGGAA